MTTNTTTNGISMSLLEGLSDAGDPVRQLTLTHGTLNVSFDLSGPQYTAICKFQTLIGGQNPAPTSPVPPSKVV